jgi:hypothetical protein
MIFDPVNSVSSIDFYKKVSGQSLGRSFLYACYLAALFAVACTLALKVKIGPVIDDTFVWLERSVPTLTYSAGRVSTPQTAPLTVKHPTIPGVSLTIDTNRSDAVTAKEMEEAKVLGFLTATAFYLREENGELRVFDLTKSANGAKPVTIDAGFYRNASIVMGRLLYPTALVATFVVFLVWKFFASIAYSVMALMINAFASGSLGYAPLLNIAIYAQTLAIGLGVVTLFMPFGIPGFSLVSVVITGVYIWLAVKRHSSPSLQPA